MNVHTALDRVLRGGSFTAEEAAQVMDTIMDGGANPVQVAGLLVALRMKGETPEEITGFASAMRTRATAVTPERRPLVDTCGTGGDGTHTFNISTVAAFVTAGAGVAVAKHGNRSVSSKSGSADLLEALGVRLDIPPDAIAAAIDDIGLGFLFAPALHPAMRHVMPIRRDLGIRTVFNILGPLANPARATHQVVGVYDPALGTVMAQALAGLGLEKALVVHGADGLDEITTWGTTKIWIVAADPPSGTPQWWDSTLAAAPPGGTPHQRDSTLTPGAVQETTLRGGDLGVEEGSLAGVQGGSPEENASIARAVLRGEPGPARDIVVVNAAAALWVAGAAPTLKDGVILAARSIDSRAAEEVLNRLAIFTTARAEEGGILS